MKTRAEIAEVISSVAAIAATLEESGLFYRGRQTADGITAMQQAAMAFADANAAPEKMDAALWCNEAYLLFSSGLPDTGSNEKSTGWATAREIAQLFGGPEIWERDVRHAFGAEGS